MNVGDWTTLMDAAQENPNPAAGTDALATAYEASFCVAVPVSGGMDSTTLWAMAGEAGLPRVPLYVRCGQEYGDAEIDAARDVCGAEPVVLSTPDFVRGRWQHIIPRRNLLIVSEIAEWMRAAGRWGEIWFGNLAGESPVARGDKSSAFFVGLAEHLVKDGPGCDTIVVQPLRALDKTDLVRWWQARGAVDVLRRTKSCFDPELRACGRCQTCFRKLVAFRAAGEPTDGMFDAPDWQPHITKYEPVMRDAVARGDWSRYSPARCRDTLAVIDELQREARL